ncbi:MAG: hypothetical protein Q4F72_12215, partial [Desulfovibrionaceae bacterium]|nr:hypothetical protein [Desulfovibrionaceae bacterium]
GSHCGSHTGGGFQSGCTSGGQHGSSQQGRAGDSQQRTNACSLPNEVVWAYRTLELPESATFEEMHQRYLTLLKLYLSSQNSGDSDIKRFAQEKIVQLDAACSILSRHLTGKS